MPNEYINLWTLHTPNFSITEGRVDHSKSKYYKDTPGVKEAYPELWRRINIPDGQIIWCYLDKTEIRKTSSKMALWEILLPESKVIQFVDDIVWNRILGIKCRVPSLLSEKWYEEAIDKFPDNPTLINCKFMGNYAGDGGGMCNGYESPFTLSHGSNPTLIKCTFNNNNAFFRGGGIYNLDSNPKLNNCTFSFNSAILFGGGMYNNNESNPILSNCTISENFADDGAAVFGGSPKLTNCIVWCNTPPEILSNASISFSDIQGSWEGESNIDIDPLFANPGYWDPNGTPDDPNDDFWVDGDYHLKSQAGRYDPASGSWPCTILGTGWVIDDVTSPCIDAGDPNSPIGDELFPNGGVINMGAYGGTAEASKSLSNTGSRFRD